ncbi:unnamed protein product, partial [Rotaria sp. Silwood2]
FWSQVLGVGDFYYELAVQIVEVCVATSSQNGGIISLDELFLRVRKARGKSRSAQDVSQDDILRAIKKLRALGDGFAVIQPINGQGRILIQSIPGELSMDHTAILNSLQTRSSFTVEQLREEFKWTDDRIKTAIDFMIKEGLLWIDNNGRNIEYYFPGLFTAQRVIAGENMTENQHTSDNRHHLAIWCRAEVFTFGALTTPPPPDITPSVSFPDKK